jgi:hypothetical protein
MRRLVSRNRVSAVVYRSRPGKLRRKQKYDTMVRKRQEKYLKKKDGSYERKGKE